MTKVQQENSAVKDRMYHCPLCEKQFKWKSEMKRHELSHNPQYNCKICNKKFSFISALRRHEKTHERIEPVLCKECGGTFRDETLLKRHLKYAHNGETFNCTKCSAYFSSEAAFQTHSKIHKVNSERRYKCRFDGCEKTFNFPHHLKHHELTHTGSKQYFCNVCGKGFIQAHHLKTHMNSHEPENWLTCNIGHCNKRFSNQYALKRHIMTHKNKKENEAAVPMIIDDQINSSKLKGHVLCESCGELIRQNQISRHTTKCQKNFKENTHIDLKISQQNLEEDSNSSLEIFAEIKDTTNRIEDIIKMEFVNCKRSGCTNKDGKPDENCLCANIATSPNNISLEDISPQPMEKAILYENLNKKMDCLSFSDKKDYTAIEEIAKNEDNINDIDFDTCKNIFGGCLVSKDGIPNENCICAKYSKRNMKKLRDCNNCMVKCDDYYKSNDIYDDKNDDAEAAKDDQVMSKAINKEINNNDDCMNKFDDYYKTNNKIADDHQIDDKDDQVNSKAVIDKRLNDCNSCLVKCEDYYKTSGKCGSFGDKDVQAIPYSCKAVLGNCIVSGDGTIGDECLCAKMYNDVNGSHEIEDLTPLSSMIWTD